MYSELVLEILVVLSGAIGLIIVNTPKKEKHIECEVEETHIYLLPAGATNVIPLFKDNDRG
jgi:hypothetical protein